MHIKALLTEIMASEEQLFDSIGNSGHAPMTTSDKAGLIETGKKLDNGSSPREENAPLHQGKTTNNLLHSPQNHGLRVIIMSSVVFAVAVTVALILTIYLEPRQVHGHAAVSCEDVRCSRIGLQLLREGGNAVDAAVGAAFCLGVVNPAHSGLGGGGFAVVHDHKFMKSYGYDFRETSPKGLTAQMLDSSKATDIVSTGVPGQLKGLAAMHKKHGVLAWKDVVGPSVDLAQQVTVSKALAKSLLKLSVKDIESRPLGDALLSAGSFKSEGDNLTLPGMVDTLLAVQADSDALYSGKLRREFVEEVQSLGGKITEEDMRNYTVSFPPKVLTSKFNDLTVIGLPPPSAGAIVALILNIVAALNWGENSIEFGDPMMYHQMLETFKYSYAQKGLLGDTDFNSSVSAEVQKLLSKDFANTLAENIKQDNKTHSDADFYGPTVPQNSGGTSHISVIDSSELMVSLTMTLNDLFGNKHLLQSGIVLNDELMDFDLTANLQAANSLHPGKRPQSSMTPNIMYSSDHPCNHRMIIGGANGSRIISGVAETVINSVVFKQAISDAVKSPRVHDQLTGHTEYEKELPQSVVDSLTKMGHTMVEAVEGLSAVQAIEKTNDDLESFADPRTFGEAVQF